MQAMVYDAIAQFCGDDPGRSVAMLIGNDHDDVFGCRANEPRPAASVIKVSLIMGLYDLAWSGEISLDTPVSVADLPTTRYVSILAAFDHDRSLSLREVAALALITSDNPATTHIVELIGFDPANDVLRAAGCSDQSIMAAGFTEAELGKANRANVLTAHDAIKVFVHLLQHDHYAPIRHVLANNLRGTRIPVLLPEDAVVVHKTGSLEGVVNDAGVVSRNGKSFTVAFLTDGQSDPAATQQDIATCSLSLFNNVIA